MWENENTCNLLEGKPPVGTPRRRCVDNIKMDLGEIGCGGVDWIDLAQVADHWRALVKTVMNLRVPQSVGNFLSGCITGGLSISAQFHSLQINRGSVQGN
jgi:hypothetical protein